MADDWSKYLTKPATPASAAPADDPWSKYEKPSGDPPKGGWQLAGDEALGAAKGFAKGVGNLAEELPTLGVPHVSELDPNAKKFLESPNATYGESIGKFVGQNAPFAIAGPEGGLGALATRAGIGALAGGVQPTRSGSWQSHAIDAGMGGLAAIVPYAPKGLLTSADSLSAWATSFAAKSTMGGGGGFWEWPLYDAVRRLGPAKAAATFARWLNRPGASGAAAGAASQKGQEDLGTDKPQ